MKLSELSIIKYEKNGNTITFLTNCSARIVVTFISDKAARLYVDFDGSSELDESYAVDTIPPASSAYPAPAFCMQLINTSSKSLLTQSRKM